MSKIKAIHCFDCNTIINYPLVKAWDERLEIQIKVCAECAKKRSKKKNSYFDWQKQFVF